MANPLLQSGQEQLDAWAPFRADAASHGRGNIELRCPVCGQQESRSPLTKGHIWPEGCRVASTSVPECERCNNNLGSSVDADLGAVALAAGMEDQTITPDQLHKFLKHHATIRDLNGEAVVPLKGYSRNGRLGLVLGYRESLPVHPNASGDGNLEITFHLPHSNIVVGGLLHTALLRLYYEFGVRFIDDGNLDRVRSRLSRAALATSAADRVSCFSGLAELCRFLVPAIAGCPDAFVLRELSGEPVAFGCHVPFAAQRGGIALLPGPGRIGAAAFESVQRGLRGEYLIDDSRFGRHLGGASAPPPVRSDPEAVFSSVPIRLESLTRYELRSPAHSFTVSDLAREGSVPIDFVIQPLEPLRLDRTARGLQRAAWSDHGLILPDWVDLLDMQG